MARLDRTFVSTDWESNYPLIRIKAVAKEGSDHTPVIVNIGGNCFLWKKEI